MFFFAFYAICDAMSEQGLMRYEVRGLALQLIHVAFCYQQAVEKCYVPVYRD
jgi:hypothetical protein